MQLLLPSLPLLLVAGIGYAVARRAWPAGGTGAAAAIGLVAALALASLGAVSWLATYVVTAFAVCLVLAALTAVLLARRRLRSAGLGDGRAAVDLAALALGCGLVGARLLFVAQNPPPTAAGTAWTIAAIADLDGGGMVWYGGALLAALAVLAWARWRRWPLLTTADAVLPAVLLGLAVGRVGCFLNGCCWGSACDLPWAVERVAADGHHERVHPVQLYETLAAATLGGLLLLPRRLPAGAVAALATGGYAAWRFLAEFLRGDHHPGARLPGVDLSVSQGISLGLLALALVLGAWSWRQRVT